MYSNPILQKIITSLQHFQYLYQHIQINWILNAYRISTPSKIIDFGDAFPNPLSNQLPEPSDSSSSKPYTNKLPKTTPKVVTWSVKTKIEKHKSSSTPSTKLNYIYDSNSDDYQTKKSPTYHKIVPIINTTSVRDTSSSQNQQKEYSTTDYSYDQQHKEIFQEGINQNQYNNGEFNEDYKNYTEDNIQDAIDYGREIGIEDTYNNLNNIERNER